MINDDSEGAQKQKRQKAPNLSGMTGGAEGVRGFFVGRPWDATAHAWYGGGNGGSFREAGLLFFILFPPALAPRWILELTPALMTSARR